MRAGVVRKNSEHRQAGRQAGGEAGGWRSLGGSRNFTRPFCAVKRQTRGDGYGGLGIDRGRRSRSPLPPLLLAQLHYGK